MFSVVIREHSPVSKSLNLSTLTQVIAHMYCHCCSVCADVIIRHQHSLLTHIEGSLASTYLHMIAFICLMTSRPFWIQARKQINVCLCVWVREREREREHHRSSNNLEQFQCSMLFVRSLNSLLLISTRWFDVKGILLHNACCIYCTLKAYVFNINGLSKRTENNISQAVLLLSAWLAGDNLATLAPRSSPSLSCPWLQKNCILCLIELQQSVLVIGFNLGM